MNRLLPAVLLIPLLGCAAMQANAVRVSAFNPRPSIDLPQSKARLALDLGAVPDAFTVPEQNGITPVPVEQWRNSLGAGFANGLAPFFAAPTGGTDFTLKFLKADLEYTPVVIYEGGGAAAVRARVTYMIQLIDSSGEVIGRMKGEALSKNPWVDAGGSQATAAEAVSQMYEEIADKAMRVMPKVEAAPAAAPTQM